MRIERSLERIINIDRSAEFQRGGFWSGNRTVWDIGGIVRPFPRLNLGLSFIHSDVDLFKGTSKPIYSNLKEATISDHMYQ